MITPLATRFRNGEFIGFHHYVVDICKNNNAGALNISAQVNELERMIGPLILKFMENPASLHTGMMDALDQRRDRALTGIRSLAASYVYHFDASLQLAGKTLLRCIDKHGKKIMIMNYAAETAVLSSIVNEMEADEGMKAAVALLNIGNWVHELKQVNEEFVSVYIERITENSERPATGTLELKMAVTEKYRQLCKIIESIQTLTPSENCNQLINELNLLAEKFNNTVRRRRNHKDGESETQQLLEE